LGAWNRNMSPEDQQYMRLALEQARKAGDKGEVPVGAVVVCEGQVVGAGHNEKETLADPTAHAEIASIRLAARRLGRWRLSGCVIYVTLEPCPMCMGALLQARLDRLVFGCPDPKAGAALTLYQMANDSRLNHRIAVEPGVLGEESSLLLKEFFRNRRQGNSSLK